MERTTQTVLAFPKDTRKHFIFGWILVAVFAGCAISACDDVSSDPVDSDEEMGTDSIPEMIILSEQNNYAFESTLHIPVVETAEGGDIEICWDAMTRDFQCHELDPKQDIDNATIVRIRNMSESEIETALAVDGLQQSNIDGYLGLETNGNTDCVNIGDFSFFGSEVQVGNEYVESTERKYLLVLTTGTTPGVGARMMTFMTPTQGSTNRSVTLSEGCDLLDFSATLTSLKPVKVSEGPPAILDWSNIAPPGITRVMLGFYEHQTPASLETQALDLMLIATKKWDLAVEPKGVVNLGDLTDAQGERFQGFEGDGTWIFALLCEKCQNPAPPFLTVLEPGKGAQK